MANRGATYVSEPTPNPPPNKPKNLPGAGQAGKGSRPNNERMTYQSDNFVGNPIAKPTDGRSIGNDGTAVLNTKAPPDRPSDSAVLREQKP